VRPQRRPTTGGRRKMMWSDTGKLKERNTESLQKPVFVHVTLEDIKKRIEHK
jgi:hypothetical protein